jgi:glutamate 5-kinase
MSSQPLVIKLGTGVLTTGIGRLNEPRIAAICSQIAALRQTGARPVIVSSGAVGLGMGRLGLKRKPAAIREKQACAAIGQSLLMQTWQRALAPHSLAAAQVLLTREDLRDRSRHLAVKSTLESILDYGAVPVINENDTVSADEIRFGDNDTLSALVAALLRARLLLILSTAPGLLDRSGSVLHLVPKITPDIESLAGGTSDPTATGGMISKIAAARLAAKSGCGVFIASGAEPEIIPRLLNGDNPGTFFVPGKIPLESKKRWIAWFQKPAGSLTVNADAARALRERNSSLLAIGVTASSGDYRPGDTLDVLDPAGRLVARGQTTFASADVEKALGKTTAELRRLFPHRRSPELIHRNALVLL